MEWTLGKLFLVINYMYNVTDKAVTGNLQLLKLHIELVNLGYVLYSILYLYSYQYINNNIAFLNNSLTKIECVPILLAFCGYYYLQWN